jgi:hypothetical protein
MIDLGYFWITLTLSNALRPHKRPPHERLTQ